MQGFPSLSVGSIASVTYSKWQSSCPSSPPHETSPCKKDMLQDWSQGLSLAAGPVASIAKTELAANQRNTVRRWREERFGLLRNVRWDRSAIVMLLSGAQHHDL